MYLKEFENVEVILKHYTQPSKWEKNLGFKPKLNESFLIHWALLKTKSEYRKKFIKVKCDDCGKIIERRIRDLNPNKNFHLCDKCKNKGERNGMFGKPKTEKQILSLEKWIKEKGNPFTWDSVKKIIKEKEKESTRKRLLKVIGQKRSQETKNKMRLSAIEGFKNGTRKMCNGWMTKTIKQYNGIDYHGTYELKFLKYLESKNKLHLIEKGPKILYKDTNGEEHNYFIDYRIKGTNIVFEIKSTYYWNKLLETNLLKEKAAKELYNYNIIMDNNFKILDKILNLNN